MRLRTLFASLMAFSAAACGVQTAGTEADDIMAENTAPPAPVVVMLGDSLTAGFQLPPDAALPDALSRALADRGVTVQMVNAGVSGDTTADGLNRYDFSVADVHPDMLVVALGANDFLNGFPPDTPKANLAAILTKAREAALPVALVGVTVPEGAGAADAREAAYAAIYPELAAEFGAPVFPDMLGAIAGRPELLMADGVHPTAAGVEAMAQPLADFLAPLITDLEVEAPEGL
jgi:acyl-CoA thioesterase-1